MQSDPMDWVAVAALPRVGSTAFLKMLDNGWSPDRVLAASDDDWQWLGLNTLARHNLAALKRGGGPLKDIQLSVADWLCLPDTRLLTLHDPHYPPLLKQIPDPPPLLYVRGNLDALHMPQMALVGSRHASRAGAQHAREFSSALTNAGLIVTSGMAHGIDSAAHQAAVNLNRPTVAVFGTGPDVLYPARNRILAGQILETGGVWVSELPPGTGPLSHNFPRRNRIISGLSAGVLVVEAAPRSGSLITARMALEQGREVFALPGALNNPLSQGCHNLIREGAHLVSGVEHILEQLAPMLGAFAGPESETETAESPAAELPPLSATEQRLLDLIGYEATGMEQLQALSGIAIAELSVALMELELKGLVVLSGDSYTRLR